MQRPFREHHLLQLLKGYDQQQLPLDVYISHYFRDHPALGSKDRAFVAETAYFLVRWKGLFETLAKEPSWEGLYNLSLTLDPFDRSQFQNLPPHIRLSFPQPLFEMIVKSHGLSQAKELCLVSNTQAPTTIRTNTLKISRDQLLKRFLQQGYDVIPCKHSSTGITFLKKIHFFSTPEFKEGLFEVQDEGSQLLAAMVQPKLGDLVMDYCSGAGGKTLAFAPQMQNKGQIYLHDIRKGALLECKKRLRRAGIQNAQIAPADDEKLKKLKKKMDWVLVDAPCSGTGTLRRNPDMKWKFTPEMVEHLVGEQRQIFEAGLSYIKPSGTIVYATCSLLNEENQAQTEHFLKTYALQIAGEPFISLPAQGGMDGFYGVAFRRK
jgi:16S rRNA C967 or C1407 C5-methylase (RsmB/RsmF family)